MRFPRAGPPGQGRERHGHRGGGPTAGERGPGADRPARLPDLSLFGALWISHIVKRECPSAEFAKVWGNRRSRSRRSAADGGPQGSAVVAAVESALLPRSRRVELRECLATRGAGVVEDPVHLVDERLGLRTVRSDTAVDEPLVRRRGHHRHSYVVAGAAGFAPGLGPGLAPGCAADVFALASRTA